MKRRRVIWVAEVEGVHYAFSRIEIDILDHTVRQDYSRLAADEDEIGERLARIRFATFDTKERILRPTQLAINFVTMIRLDPEAEVYSL